MKKKLLSFALAAVMVMGMATTGLASTVTETSGDEKVTLTKSYTITGTAPNETFYLIQDGEGKVEDSTATTAPDLDYTEIDSVGKVVASVYLGGSETTSGQFEIGLPVYSKVGVYTYTLKEFDGSTAGVTYDTDSTGEYTLYVYVTNKLDDYGYPTGELKVEKTYIKNSTKIKIDSITNKYEAGSLKVTKKVKGSLGDTSKKFTFKVIFAAPDTGEDVDWSLVTGEVAGSTVSLNLESNLSYEFELADGETAEFKNLPDGVTYKVSETSENGYDVAYDGNEEGTISNGETSSTTITNTATATVDTGIDLDTLPYIMILAVVFAGVAYMVFRRRLSDKY